MQNRIHISSHILDPGMMSQFVKYVNLLDPHPNGNYPIATTGNVLAKEHTLNNDQWVVKDHEQGMVCTDSSFPPSGRQRWTDSSRSRRT